MSQYSVQQIINPNKKMKKMLFSLTVLFCFVSSRLLSVQPIPIKVTKEVAGIILTIHDGSSYDPLFSQVAQQSKEGSVVLTYTAESSAQKAIYEALQGNFSGYRSNLRQFVGNITLLSQKCPSCVVFNWECSSGYSDKQFPNRGKYTFGLLKIILQKGYLAMFSDFSLKALIKSWNKNVLGPNPFVQVGETSTQIHLKFDKNRLLRSPSSQLQAVTQLAKSDELFVHVLGGTITYGVDSRVDPEGKYELEVLTIASNFRAPSSYLQSKIDRYTGLAGHVLLSYPGGGKILTSMGHWIELMKVETTEQQLFDTAQKLYGQQQVQKMKIQYSNLANEEQKLAYQAKKSIMYIQNQSPGTNNALANQNLNIGPKA